MSTVQQMTKDGIIILVRKMKNLQPRQVLSEQYIFQIVENYYPSKQFQGWLGFRLSDGFTKIKAFICDKNPLLNSLQTNRDKPLQFFPIIIINQLIDITSTQKGEIEPFIMVKDYEIQHEQLEKVIGDPLSYKTFEEKGFRNPNGRSDIPNKMDNIDLFELQRISLFQDEDTLQSREQSKSHQMMIRDSRSKKVNINLNQEFKYDQPIAKMNLKNVNVQNQNEYFNKQQIQKQQNIQTSISKTTSTSILHLQSKQKAQMGVQQRPQINQYQIEKQIQKNDNFSTGYQRQIAQKDPTVECFPISLLNNMTQHPFKGRIVKMDEIKQYGGKNGRKEGKFFSIQVLDENDLLIATFFDGAVDKFYHKLRVGQVYVFQGAQLKLSRNPDINKQIGAINFDATFDINCKIDETDDDPQIKQNKFNFTKIDKIKQGKNLDIVDVIGIIKESGQVQEFQPKYKNEKMIRRNITIYDDTLNEVEINIFGNLAQLYKFDIHEIYQFKSFKINEYNGKKNIQTNFNSSIHDDLSLKESLKLAQWRMNAGDNLKFEKQNLEEKQQDLKFISAILEETKVCENDKNLKVYSNFRGHIMYVKTTGTLFYQSCQQCLKRAIIDQMSGQYYCSICQLTMSEPKYRYILNIKVVDSTGTLWITIGDASALQIISTPAEQIKQFQEQGNEKEKNEALNESLYKEMRFKIVSKAEEFNDVLRVKHQVISIDQNSDVADAQQYLKQINFYLENI